MAVYQYYLAVVPKQGIEKNTALFQIKLELM